MRCDHGRLPGRERKCSSARAAFPETCTSLRTIDAERLTERTGGLITDIRVQIRINRHVADADVAIVVGPVVPYEVVASGTDTVHSIAVGTDDDAWGAWADVAAFEADADAFLEPRAAGVSYRLRATPAEPKPVSRIGRRADPVGVGG
ncbi:MAG TPA: hypothetical protein VFP34_03175 [Microlunatus sp.]|nr:hypothetical protein [Microlunatus sp.]